MPPKVPKLARRLDGLEALHGPQSLPAVRGALEWILWENVAYLLDDAHRRAAFAALKKRVGTTAKALCAARPEVLLELASMGGMRPQDRAEKLREIGEIAAEEFEGNVDSALALPSPKARRALQKFPGIGAPGAEKILLFTGTEPVLALESNGLRVLLRLGYGEEAKNYAVSYRSAQTAASKELPSDCEALVRAYLLLRRHGQELCKRESPDCDACPLSESCAWARAHS